MRCAVLAFVLALLLPSPLALGARAGGLAPAPLDFFGGEPGLRAAGPVLIAEVYYHALRADEYVVLANVAGRDLDLAGWSLTDGEGVLTFPSPAPLPPDAQIVIAQNATAYREDALRTADYQYGGGPATPMVRTATFQLNNDGDEVVLRDAEGATVDVFAYGISPYAGEGWSGPPAAKVGQGLVARRAFAGAWQDTDTAADWDLVRVWSLGQSEFAPATFAFTGRAFAFVSPDAQAGPLLDLLGNATTSLDLSLYTLTNTALGQAIREAVARGVRVRILLEGAPVGGIDSEQWGIVQRLAPTGAQVHFLVDNTSRDIQERYRFAHAKYAILDGRTVLVSTENWGASAFPTWEATGSRGWLVAVEHPPLAAYFTRVFEEDFDARRRDVHPLAEMAVNPTVPRTHAPAARAPRFPPVSISGPFRVLPVIGPDTTLAGETILGALRGAGRSIHAEVFYAHTSWGPFPNLYLEELIAAARRGVEVRILLDASWYNVDEDDPIDNDDTVRYVNGVAAAEGLDLQAKLVDLAAHGLTQLHAKGLVVDGRVVLVSSVNWNRNSPTANREAGLLVENEALAAYFEDVFAWDWKGDVTPPFADAGPDRAVEVGESVAFSGLGSSDDVGIANYSWDFDGDGTWDAWGPEATFAWARTGAFPVRLRVADAWGNAAEDIATVVVRSRPDVPAVPWIPIALTALAVVAILSFALVQRRRKGSNTAR